MFRGIVLGEFWGIDEGVWVQLWSGVMGAVVSAVVAASVAMAVLKLTNGHQSNLADRQLAEQRSEARDVRKKAVMADVLGAANGFTLAADSGPKAVEAQRVQFETHAFRWGLETGNTDHALELLEWGTLFLNRAWEMATKKESIHFRRADTGAALGKAIVEFTSLCLIWAREDESSWPDIITVSEGRRAEHSPQSSDKA